MVRYEFDSLCHDKKINYIFQHVKDRVLTAIYHSHDFYELILVLHGGGVQMVNGEELPIGAGDVLLLRPEDLHSFLSQSEDIEIVSLSVRKKEFERFELAYEIPEGALCLKQERPIVMKGQNLSVIYGMIGDKETVRECDCKLLLSFFFCLYAHNAQGESDGRDIPDALSYAMEQMKRPEHLKVGIPAFISLSNYSHSHLSRLMKAHFGIGLKEYINALRLHHAYNEIVFTNTPVEEIAQRLGFASYSHFYRIFKASFSLSPSSLRRGERRKG